MVNIRSKITRTWKTMNTASLKPESFNTALSSQCSQLSVIVKYEDNRGFPMSLPEANIRGIPKNGDTWEGVSRKFKDYSKLFSPR